ncbi:predicted protein, partial [Nematostella vectensis]
LKLAEEAGFPAGVINTIPCTRERVNEVTDAFLKSSLVTKMSFTGSDTTGKILMAKCVVTVKKMSLELGGNAPFVVFNSADIDKAVNGAVVYKFRNTAQVMCANRILVQDEIFYEFAKRFAAAVDKHLKVGNGMDNGTTQGPLINKRAIKKVERHVADALSKSARLMRGGHRHPQGENFFEPTVLTDVNQDTLVCMEETFGPLAPLFR